MYQVAQTTLHSGQLLSHSLGGVLFKVYNKSVKL